MKFWISGLFVCLFSAQELYSQSSNNSPDSWNAFQMQRLAAVAQEFSTNLSRTSSVSSTDTSSQDAVVSIQRLNYKTNKPARQLFKKGMREYFRHHNEEALSMLQKGAVLDPRSSALQNNIGVIYCRLGKMPDAQAAFQKAVALDSSSVTSYVNLSAVAFSTNQHPLAEASARQALRIAPLSPEAGVMLALAEVAQDHWTAEARKLLEENRSQFSQASLVLQHWPTKEQLRSGLHRAVLVRSAGPASLAESTDTNIGSGLLPR
jgi:tetratricopeptide (TPR) repeat protein